MSFTVAPSPELLLTAFFEPGGLCGGLGPGLAGHDDQKPPLLSRGLRRCCLSGAELQGEVLDRSGGSGRRWPAPASHEGVEVAERRLRPAHHPFRIFGRDGSHCEAGQVGRRNLRCLRFDDARAGPRPALPSGLTVTLPRRRPWLRGRRHRPGRQRSAFSRDRAARIVSTALDAAHSIPINRSNRPGRNGR